MCLDCVSMAKGHTFNPGPNAPPGLIHLHLLLRLLLQLLLRLSPHFPPRIFFALSSTPNVVALCAVYREKA